jgi:hypothetical protein
LLWHHHAVVLSLIRLGNDVAASQMSSTSLDFLLLLDERTASTPVSRAAVTCAVALDTESFTDLTTLDHGVAGFTYVSKFPEEASWKLFEVITYIQPQPVKYMIPHMIMQSPLKVS